MTLLEANGASAPPVPVESALAPVRGAAAGGDYSSALALLSVLEQGHPNSGLLYQERGGCYRALGDSAAAIAAYRRAVELNHALTVSWQALAQLYRAAGRSADASYAAACLEKMTKLPQQLRRGASLLNEGELNAAEDVVRDHLRRHGPDTEGMRLLAQIAVRLEVLDDAEFLLEKVLERAPDYQEARYEYCAVLTQRRRYVPALVHARR